MIDLRDCFWNDIYERMKKDERIVILAGDQGALIFDKIKQEMPKRFFNLGIQEQNIISVAAGMAREGLLPVVYAITPFITYRCFEQIKLDIAMSKLPVLIVGMGTGFCYSFEGPTHHAVHDIGTMRTIPELNIYNPSYGVGMTYCLNEIFYLKQPAYLRLDKKMVRDQEFAPILNRIKTADTIVLSTGMNETIKEIQDELGKEDIIFDTGDIFVLRPLATNFSELAQRYKRFIVVEEHSHVGGLKDVILEALGNEIRDKEMIHLALPHEHIHLTGDRGWLLKQFGLDKESIKQKIRQVVSGENRG